MADDRQTDVDLAVQRVLGGEIDAYSAVIRLFQGDVWRLVTSLLYDREATQDIVQESFIKAFFQLRRYKPGTSFRAWILTVARNTALNALRSRSRKSKHLDAYREDGLAEVEVQDSGEALDESRSLALRECRETLPEHSRALLAMRYAEQLEVETIAARIGRSIEAVRQTFWRIRGALRDCIEKKTAQA
jgi:RNA polymerase sigma-70 factor (ECF subfamily)